MKKVPFLDEQLEVAFMKSFSEDISSRSSVLREKFVSPDNVLKFSHGRRWEMPANELGDKEGSVQKHSTDTAVSLHSIVSGDSQVIFDNVAKVTDEMNKQLTAMVIETVERGAESSGQVFNAAGRPFYEGMYDALERMPPSLNADGELSLPNVLTDSSQSEKIISQLKTAGPEFEKRFDALKAQKKAEAIQDEKNRMARFELREAE